MKLKEAIKLKVDQLEVSDLKVVDSFIDSLKNRRSKRREKAVADRPPYLTVIELMGSNTLSSDDILAEREERI